MNVGVKELRPYEASNLFFSSFLLESTFLIYCLLFLRPFLAVNFQARPGVQDLTLYRNSSLLQGSVAFGFGILSLTLSVITLKLPLQSLPQHLLCCKAVPSQPTHSQA